MEIFLPKDKTFVVAVSGGVDSMVLLDLLTKNQAANNWRLIIAHIDHGIRADSAMDRELVEKVASENGLTFRFCELALGETASEGLARAKRYQFLDSLVKKHKADFIVTAHHQDDLLETAILNLIRGTGRKGLTSLINNKSRLRPLINYPKTDIIDYANRSDITWREDPTNTSSVYLRNYIRMNLLPRFGASAKAELFNILNNLSVINEELDTLLTEVLRQQSRANEIDKLWFSLLPHSLAREVLASWLRDNNLAGFSRPTLERLVVYAKVARVNQQFPILNNHYLIVNKNTLSLS